MITWGRGCLCAWCIRAWLVQWSILSDYWGCCSADDCRTVRV